MRISTKFYPVILIIVTAAVVVYFFTQSPVIAKDNAIASTKIHVDTITLAQQPYQVIVNSYGTIIPRTKTSLSAEVAGKIIAVSDQFVNGGSFKKGDVLVKLDDRDYIANVKIAEAKFILAKEKLLETEARAIQAKEDWDKNSPHILANDLVLHKPQLETAKANKLSAQAELLKAQISLERTEIIAPYHGKISSKTADLGQVVAQSTLLAEIYSSDVVEARLPIKNKDLSFIKNNHTNNKAMDVSLYSDLGGENTWQGFIDRSEGVIDGSSQQLNIFVQINQDQQSKPLIIGQYVTARITGIMLKKSIVIPNDAIYLGSYVYVEKEGRIYRRDISVFWHNDSESVIEHGLNHGDKLVVTPLGSVSSGTAVKVNSSKETHKVLSQENK